MFFVVYCVVVSLPVSLIMASTTANLLDYLRVDANPPIAIDRVWTDWDWLVRPLLGAYAQTQKVPFGTDSKLPALFPGDLFSTHRLHTRNAYREKWLAAESGRPIDFATALNRANARATEAAFGERAMQNEIRGSAGTGLIAPWVTHLCTLVDPYEFPLESVIYAKQRGLVEALDTIKLNVDEMEQYRRERVSENMRLYDDVRRLTSTLYAMRRLRENVDRVIRVTVPLPAPVPPTQKQQKQQRP